jgi:CBS-domain-containing membrane protein
VPGAPVTDEDGTYLGTASRPALAAAGDDAVRAALDPAAGTVASAAGLATGIDALSAAGGHWVTVTDDQRRVTGILSAGDIMRAYRRALGPAAATPATATPATATPATGTPARAPLDPGGSATVRS